MIVPRVPHLLYGGDYNPEQWPEEVWQEDVRLMRRAGVNLVSLGIFSWALLEPRPGQYEFGWLDRILDLLAEHGIMADLATATASPPPWLAKVHPETLPVTAAGVTLWPGGRQQFCPSSPAYLEAAAALVTRLADRYRTHPALAMWHVNNEYGPTCYCDISAVGFRAWLVERYGTIDALNFAWGTSFWSQRYDDWSEINPPRTAPTFVNPTQQLDFQRFSSDALLHCFEQEYAILKERTPDIPVTTNFMGFFKPVDYWRWAAREDVVSDDSYPDPGDPDAPLDSAMRYDLNRSLGGGRPWLLMEQTPSQVNWRPYNLLKRPGQMRLWSYQAIARGADGVMFFQWRQSRAGAEKFHGAMVPHVGIENSRVWREVAQLGNELKGLDALLDTRIQTDVAMLFDWDSWWALELDSKPTDGLRLLDQVKSYYAPLFARNIPVDFRAPNVDLSGYRVLLVPNLYQVHPGVAENIERFVAGGGTLVMSFFSGIVDQHEHAFLGGYPAPFRRMLGLRVEEFDPYLPGQQKHFRTSDGATFTCSLWSDLLDLEGAQALAVYEDDFYAGRPAVTRHSFGQGAAYYLGTRPDPTYISALLDRVCRETGVAPLRNSPAGVEIVCREREGQSFCFVLNHTAAPVDVPLDIGGWDLLTGEAHTGMVHLDPYGVAIVAENSTPLPLVDPI